MSHHGFFKQFISIVAIAWMATGCSVYKSNDRDYFDGNALSGAPQASAQSEPLLNINACSYIKEEDLGLVFEAQEVSSSRAVTATSSSCYLQGHNVKDLSPFSVRCTLDLAPRQDMSDTIEAKIVTGDVPGRDEFGVAASFKVAASRDLSWSCKTVSLTANSRVPADKDQKLEAYSQRLEEFTRTSAERALGPRILSQDPIAP